MSEVKEAKIGQVMSNAKKSKWQQYCDLVVGSRSFWFCLKYELINLLLSPIPGALGIGLRKWIYPSILGKVGKGIIFGHHVTFRHPRKIEIGEGTVIDDYSMIDAKGSNNCGISIGKHVYIGRQSIIYCKNGDIVLEDKVNLGHRCIIFSANHLHIGEGTMVAADCYAMSGGVYDYKSPVKYAEQDGAISKGPLSIGSNCWIGAKAVILDGASVGNHSVIGAGAVVTDPVPERSIAVGVPAKVIKKIESV